MRAAQRELLPKLTKILLSKPSREIAAESHQIYCYESCSGKIGAEAHQNNAARADQKNIAVESHQNIAVNSCPERISAEAHQNIAVKAVQKNCYQITTKYCCGSCPEKKHGMIPGKTEAAKTADGTNAFSSC